MKTPIDDRSRSLWLLAWPLVVTMFLQFSVGLADVYVAGRFRPEVQGAIGFAGQMLFLFSVIANGLGVGLVAIIARYTGANNPAAAWHAARQGLLLAICIALPFAAAGTFVSRYQEVFFFLAPQVAGSAAALLPYYAAALLPQTALTVAAAIFRARTSMHLILLCSGSTALLNLFGDFALAFGWFGLPTFGPTGIALATIGSSLFGASLATGILVSQGMGHLTGRLDRTMAGRLWRLGWPVGALQLGWHLASLVLFAILSRLPSGAVAATAALTNGLRIEAVLYLPAFALNMIAAVLTSRALGENDAVSAMRTGWTISWKAALVLSLLAVPVFLYSRELAAVLSPDPLVRELTHLYLRFNMLSQPFMALSVCLAGALEGAGDTLGTMKTVLLPLWTIRIPLAFFLALATPLGASGVWLAMVISMVIQCLLIIDRYRKGHWQTIKLMPAA